MKAETPNQPRTESGGVRKTVTATAAVGPKKSSFPVKVILVPTDFSECAAQALRYAIPLAVEHQAAITLLYVAASNYTAGSYGFIDYPAIEGDILASGHKQLASLAEAEVAGQVESHLLVRAGLPPLEIVEAAREIRADLIVISTHGRTGLKHAWLGSVAEQVVRRAPCPVLVVRELSHDSSPAVPIAAAAEI